MTGAYPSDLTQGYVRKEIASRVIADIDAYAVATYDGGPRTHLGASTIGAPCVRATWYDWRWMGIKPYDGRMQRLFQRGHLEEARFIEYIRGIGGEVWEVDPNTGKQFKVSRLGGHFGGSLDGIVQLPLNYSCGSYNFLAEFKTKGTGRGFDKLKSDGVMMTNSQHYDQMSTYGWNYKLPYSIYFAVNKNDDDLHVEVVPLNFKRAEEVEAKANFVIRSQEPPPKIAQSPTFTTCRHCKHLNICHHGATPARNCRSCVYAHPVDNAQWFCAGHRITLAPETIKTGCQQWTPLK